MNKEEAEEFVKVVLQLQSFYDEISTMAKKSSDSPLNKFKLKFINETLEAINLLLGNNKPFKDFAVFSADEMPTNSDVTVILSQYLKSAAKHYNQHTRVSGTTRYLLEGGELSRTIVERLYILESVYR